MIPKECKRLAEVDFPIAEVSRHAAVGPDHFSEPGARAPDQLLLVSVATGVCRTPLGYGYWLRRGKDLQTLEL